MPRPGKTNKADRDEMAVAILGGLIAKALPIDAVWYHRNLFGENAGFSDDAPQHSGDNKNPVGASPHQTLQLARQPSESQVAKASALRGKRRIDLQVKRNAIPSSQQCAG